MIKYCKNCKKKLHYKIGEGLRDWSCRKFCNLKCYWKHREKNYYIGNFKTGHRGSVGENNGMWRGDKVSYRVLHRWVQRKLGKPVKCESCDKKRTTIKSIQWANISRQYKRNLNDYIALCVSCHRKYDKPWLKRKTPYIPWNKGLNLKKIL